MMRSRLRLLRHERGSALVIVLGMLLVLAISTAAVLDYTSTNARSANYSEAGQIAFALAEAGLNEAAATLSENPGPRESIGPTSKSFEGGSVTWSGTENTTYHLWTITATSTVRNPTGGSPVQRTLTRTVRVVYNPGISGGNEAWNYLYAGAESWEGCSLFQNSFETTSPVFIKNDLCMAQSATIKGGSGNVVKVGGHITFANTSKIGEPGSPVGDVSVRGGCGTSDWGPWSDLDCSPPLVYATNSPTLTEDLNKPPVDLGRWHIIGKPGPWNDCTPGYGTGSGPSTYGNGFDTDLWLNESLGDVDLFSRTYDCQVRSDGALLGQIAYDDSSKALTVFGAIFIDGDLTLGDNDQVVYSGKGVIYASGKITITGSTTICGKPGCPTEGWDPNQDMLTFVAGESVESDGFLIGQSAKFQGGVYAVNDFHAEQSAGVEGPVVARRLVFEQAGYADKWVPLSGLSMGTPAFGSEVVAQPVPGSWGG